MKELLKKFEHSANIGDLLMSNFDILLAARDKQSLKEFVEFCIVGKCLLTLNLNINTVYEYFNIN